MATEYKSWLNLSNNEDKAKLAKASIAIANHGGGFIVIGMAEGDDNFVSKQKPDEFPNLTQDAVNNSIKRYADPSFHVRVTNIQHSETNVDHPIIEVPGNHAEPIMCKRECDGIIVLHKCYIRKPGPESEEPQTKDEWRLLLNRCVQAQRESMLDSIRAIVTGHTDKGIVKPDHFEGLEIFCVNARKRWQELVDDLPADNPARFPNGHYELSFSFPEALPANNLNELDRRLDEARRIKLTGWSTFLKMQTPEWSPRPYKEFIEAWTGKPIPGRGRIKEVDLCDFWRASLEGKLVTLRGYSEDKSSSLGPGKGFDVALPIWRVGEGLLFASRLARTFDDVDRIVVKCRYSGLSGRMLTRESDYGRHFENRICQTDEITLKISATQTQINDNLTEIMHELLKPLYEQFNFFDLPIQLVESELNKLRNRRF